MFVLVLIIHILVCFALMAVVLMQSGKGRGLAGAFGGGGGNQTIFGGRGAVDFLGKATWILGGAFMVTSLSLALLSAGHGASTGTESLIKKSAGTAPATMPTGGPMGSPDDGSSGSPGSPASPGGSMPSGNPGTASPSPAPQAPAGGSSGGGK